MSGKHQELVEHRVILSIRSSGAGFRIRIAIGIWVRKTSPEKSRCEQSTSQGRCQL